jgi:dipeptidyl aminopeptidase/acylaminoacyl peptidase
VAAGLLLLCGGASPAAAPSDSNRITRPNYQQAMKYTTDFLRQYVYDSSVNPQWIGKTEVFWYSFRTSKGTRYWKVNSQLATKEPLFDHARLAMALSQEAKKPYEQHALPLSRGRMNDEGTKFTFVVEDFQYEWDLPGNALKKLGKAPARQGPTPPGWEQMTEEQRQRFQEMRDRFQRRERDRDDLERRDEQQQQEQQQEQQQQQQTTQATQGPGRGGPDSYKAQSPDKKRYVYAFKHNLYMAEEGKENEAVQLTKDGVEDYSFSSTGGGAGGGFRNRNETNTTTTTSESRQAAAAERKTRPAVTWSSDSKMFYVSRTDSRGLKELYLVNSLANPRPTLEKYKYPMPGENDVRKFELFHCDADAKKLTRIKPKWYDERYSNVHWGKTSDELRFIRRDRLQRNIEVCALNLKSGECKCLVGDGFENAPIEFQNVRYIDETDEMIWWSERSGWGHYYLYDRNGKLKNAITSGEFRASRIEAVDPKNRLLYFRGNGREPGENVYFQHLYCVRLDGSGLTLMDPDNANHNATLSPSRQYVVDNYSRVDLAPVTVLRDSKGNKIMELERADLSRLEEAGWKMPETFVVKAADGVTDLYGNLWKPFDFDASKKYPIIANVYPGPQQEGVTHTFSATANTQQLAQLGFIVIQVGHRGGTPTRSKAYHRYGYGNLRDYGLADKKAAIEQLAARYPFMDIERVGIYGHSGGGFMSAAALLQKPYNEFFRAAVASAGNHDNNIYNDYWAERYHGLKETIVKKEEKKTTGAGTAAGGGGGPENGAQQGQEKKEGEDKAKQDIAKQEQKAGEKKDAQKTEEKTEVKEERTLEIKVPTNTELAANLKGALLLVHGEADNNVHPANTMRLVDALIKANKRFDMLIIPGKRHGFGDAQTYFTQRMWEFFAEHLMDDRQAGADILEKRPR